VLHPSAAPPGRPLFVEEDGIAACRTLATDTAYYYATMHATAAAAGAGAAAAAAGQIDGPPLTPAETRAVCLIKQRAARGRSVRHGRPLSASSTRKKKGQKTIEEAKAAPKTCASVSAGSSAGTCAVPDSPGFNESAAGNSLLPGGEAPAPGLPDPLELDGSAAEKGLLPGGELSRSGSADGEVGGGTGVGAHRGALAGAHGWDRDAAGGGALGEAHCAAVRGAHGGAHNGVRSGSGCGAGDGTAGEGAGAAESAGSGVYVCALCTSLSSPPPRARTGWFVTLGALSLGKERLTRAQALSASTRRYCTNDLDCAATFFTAEKKYI